MTEAGTSKELKVCPFCGSEASLFVLELFPEMKDKCRCSKETCILHRHWIEMIEWNTRPIEDALRAKLEVAMKALDWFEDASNYLDVDGYSGEEVSNHARDTKADIAKMGAKDGA